ncbi:MAG: tRNA (adenosine(37)-N6)-threonylcarbamoyltransferase complex ATPase subunit type 1 TsaE [Deltaproteobacteria bacterium]|jgi:tRNA threonylcarbamoyladenosine biosynthesis protein TsaE|nr:tRNA (adenosine(37)-N6)-threonylcarbamoyltransferase complex ATPase subunit type 1 TsaE [Deltaproteobacteria bacterium]
MLKTLIIETCSEEQTIMLGEAIGKILEPGDVIYLEGDLGSGKTRLAKGIISAATCVSADEVVSPSFTLINRFEGDFPVYHADLYRIDADQVEDIGLEEPLSFGSALVVEWAEKMPPTGDPVLEAVIQYAEKECFRKIVFQWSDDGPWANRFTEALSAWTGIETYAPTAQQESVPEAILEGLK